MDPPTVSVSSSICFYMQAGVVKDTVKLDVSELTLKTLKENACNFIDKKLPDHGLNRLAERLMLFRHDYSSENMLLPINAVSDVTEDSVVEIVVSANPPSEVVLIRPHSLLIHSYKSPAFCDFCGEMLFGLFHQGLKCEGCGLNYHKRCAYKIPNNCTYGRRRRSSTHLFPPSSLGGDSSSNVQRTNSSGALINDMKFLTTSPIRERNRQSSVSTLTSINSNFSAGRPAWVEKELADRIRVPHTFVVHSYTRPTVCQHCKKLLKGLFRQGFQCKDCKFNVHKKCIDKVPYGCAGEAPKEYGDNPEDDNGYDRNEEDGVESDTNNTSLELKAELETKTTTKTNKTAAGSSAPDASTSNGSEASSVTDEDCQQQNTSSDWASNNIPLQRVVQSIKHVKRIGSKVMKSGYLAHWTDKNPTKKVHFWRLDTKTITLFQNETTTNYYVEIPLADIMQISTNNNAHTSPSYAFELRTKNNTYYVGDDANVAKTWELALRQALMPILCKGDNKDSNAGMCTAKDSGSASHSNGEDSDDISQQYQIFIDEILGAGQFGTVYGGMHRNTKRRVAIKVIDKHRFPSKNKDQLRNEVLILQNISHPGVVNLERMFENTERIFVVMEKLSDDMLEMIISKPNSRLPERVTKFLIYQILVALKYLHSQNICHCDLKPENVLLATNCQFPQIKLCDFGFARIIGEKSFRRSVVGTLAYLAPEVIRNKKYNRSLDMWSVGVIIYVSLSGTFPFNEEEDIQDQITNAAFMYPAETWQDISKAATDLIGKLLQVASNKRYSVERTLQDRWLDDYEVWCDLRRLEKRVNMRWLTHESDESRWEKYRVDKSLPVPDFGSILSVPPSNEETENEEEKLDRFTTNNSFRRTHGFS